MATATARYHGPGYACEPNNTTPLDDAVSQMLSLCVRWRLSGERLVASKLKRLQALWSRQRRRDGGADDVAGRPASAATVRPLRPLSALMLQHLLEAWQREAPAPIAPQHCAARAQVRRAGASPCATVSDVTG
jgi:hypothetical protein